MTCGKTITANFKANDPATGGIWGNIWQDGNTNSTPDQDERGMAGIRVNLYRQSGNIIMDTQKTDDNGDYAFHDILPGDYVIRIVPPVSYCFSPRWNASEVDNNGFSDSLNLTAGTLRKIDAGIYRPEEHSFPNYLSQGWNLVAMPGLTAPETINYTDFLKDILTGLLIIYTYDETDNSFKSLTDHPSEDNDQPTQIQNGKGYWFGMKEPGTFVIPGETSTATSPDLPSYTLHTGWNLLGFTSYQPVKAIDYFTGMQGKYDIIYGYRDGAYYIIADDDLLIPGQGYWIHMNQETTFYPYARTAGALTPNAAQNLIRENQNDHSLVILDVRGINKLVSGKIANAITLHYNAPAFENDLDNLARETTCLVYCDDGSKSQNATDLMIQSGFREVYYIKGGLAAYTAAGLLQS